jgi:hypothetical protein
MLKQLWLRRYIVLLSDDLNLLNEFVQKIVGKSPFLLEIHINFAACAHYRYKFLGKLLININQGSFVV